MFSYTSIKELVDKLRSQCNVIVVDVVVEGSWIVITPFRNKHLRSPNMVLKFPLPS